MTQRTNPFYDEPKPSNAYDDDEELELVPPETLAKWREDGTIQFVEGFPSDVLNNFSSTAEKLWVNRVALWRKLRSCDDGIEPGPELTPGEAKFLAKVWVRPDWEKTVRGEAFEEAADFIGSRKAALLTPQQLAARVRSGEFE